MDAQSHGHRYLLCPHCKLTQRDLSIHLKKVCMSKATAAERAATLASAKKEAAHLLRRGRVWDYSRLMSIMQGPNATTKMIKELQDRGNAVINIPAPETHAPETPAPAVTLPAPTQRRHTAFTQGSLTQKECIAVLQAAKHDFLSVITMLKSPEKSTVSCREHLLVLHYLEALIVLKHQQLPAVVENMTVSEWKQRDVSPDLMGHCVVVISATQMGTFVLNQEEEKWMDLYFKEVRPEMLANRLLTSSEDDGDDTRFFITSSGKPIYRCSKDIGSLQDKYKVPRVTGQMSRCAFKAGTEDFNDAEKSLFTEYLAHSNQTAKRDYRKREPKEYLAYRKLLDRACGKTDSSSDEEHPSTSKKARSELDTYKRFMQAFPITLDGTCPGRARRTEVVGSVLERSYYDRWRTEQKMLREKHVLENFSRRQPNENRVKSWMESQGWTANMPDAQLIVQQWKPSGTVCAALDNPLIRKMVTTQKWKGLLVTNTAGKGRGVFTTRTFAKGEVVCDYHGRIVTHKEGLKTHKGTEMAETGYMFFYKNNRGDPMCIDAHEEHCECHPDFQTYGRLINHSADSPNLRPRLFSLEDKDVLLFFAIRDIVVDEELTFDYGVSKSSFAGEGMDLDWI